MDWKNKTTLLMPKETKNKITQVAQALQVKRSVFIDTMFDFLFKKVFIEKDRNFIDGMNENYREMVAKIENAEKEKIRKIVKEMIRPKAIPEPEKKKQPESYVSDLI